MRRLASSSALLVLATSLVVAGHRDAPEPFPAFFARFVQDSAFRMSRIKFPLHAILGNPTDPRIRETWSPSELDAKFTVPIASNRLEAEGLEQVISVPSESAVEVKQSQPESDSYILMYRFKQKQGQWFLVEFENGYY